MNEESRRFKRMIKNNAVLAVRVATFGDGIMSPNALKAIVRHQCVGLVEDDLLNNDNVLSDALEIMVAQN